MRWHNSAWAILQHIEYIQEQKRLYTGRGVRFKRERPSLFHKIKHSQTFENRTMQNVNNTQEVGTVITNYIKET